MQAIKLLCFILGLFEFFAVYQFNSQDENILIIEHARLLKPFFIRDNSAKMIYSGFLLMLGLQRLTWATVNSSTSLYSWIVLILLFAMRFSMNWQRKSISYIYGYRGTGS